MIRSLKFSLLAALLILLAAPASSFALASRAQACPAAYSQPNQANLARVSSATVCLINYERVSRRVSPLRPNRALTAAAARHSRDMAARNYFSHSTMGGGSFTSRIMAARYTNPRGAWSVGENLAWGTGQLGTPAATVEAWMRSPGHRANILKGSFKEIGLGLVLSGPKAIYTTDFGSRG
jgi:uncharacterized protein YkwD